MTLKWTPTKFKMMRDTQLQQVATSVVLGITTGVLCFLFGYAFLILLLLAMLIPLLVMEAMTLYSLRRLERVERELLEMIKGFNTTTANLPPGRLPPGSMLLVPVDAPPQDEPGAETRH